MTADPSSTASRFGRPATGALIDAGFASLGDLPDDLNELDELDGVGLVGTATVTTQGAANSGGRSHPR